MTDTQRDGPCSQCDLTGPEAIAQYNESTQRGGEQDDVGKTLEPHAQVDAVLPASEGLVRPTHGVDGVVAQRGAGVEVGEIKFREWWAEIEQAAPTRLSVALAAWRFSERVIQQVQAENATLRQRAEQLGKELQKSLDEEQYCRDLLAQAETRLALAEVQIQAEWEEAGATFPDKMPIAKRLAQAQAELTALRRVADAAMRLQKNKYLPWTNAGGPNECKHGWADGISCPRCDENAISAYSAALDADHQRGSGGEGET